MKNNIIFLLGFMGTGKTSLGKRLASKLNYPFYDTDQLIEAVSKKKFLPFLRSKESISFGN